MYDQDILEEARNIALEIKDRVDLFNNKHRSYMIMITNDAELRSFPDSKWTNTIHNTVSLFDNRLFIGVVYERSGFLDLNVINPRGVIKD
jgi:hypothetical protein